MRKKIADNRISLVISFAFVLITLGILFYLTFQTPDDTVALSERVGHLPVVDDFLNWVGAFVDWSVRQWAHDKSLTSRQRTYLLLTTNLLIPLHILTITIALTYPSASNARSKESKCLPAMNSRTD